MNKDRRTGRRSEKGIALLIAIFVLLLISVVAIALLVSSGTETALGANYRASSTVYYAALAGLEEARGRLLPKNPTYFGAAVISPTTQFPLGQTLYVINRLQGENIVPWDSSNMYYDKEYQSEFNAAASSASFQSVPSVWDNNIQGFPGPIYKWVRITAATERSLYLDVNADGVYDLTTPIYYNPAQVDSLGNAAPSLILTPIPPSTAVQVLQITALAYLPNGSQKLLQYVVAPTQQSLSFPAALTMDGPNAGNNPSYPFAVPWGAGFVIDGVDQYFYSGPSGCVAGANPSATPVRAIGYSNTGGTDASLANIMTAIQQGQPPPNNAWNYGDFKGLGGALPNVYYVGSVPPSGPPTISANMLTLPEVNSLVTSISQSADVSLTGPVTQSDSNNLMPSGMSATNPMTVVVNGDFTENGWSGTGYGTLLVTGTFTYDPNSSWNGVILVIGKGVFTSLPSGFGGGPGQINGAVFVATTVDGLGTPLASLGSPTFHFTGSGSSHIYYSSCWVQYTQAPAKYQVLSFHEIPQS
jgi:hypothetical protein